MSKRFPIVNPVASLGTRLISCRIRSVFAFSLFLAAALVLILRVPYLLCAPRLWAEDGTVYFVGAWNTPGLVSLFQSYYFGYYSLYENLVMLLSARWVPLEYVPYAAMLASLAVQMIPIAIVCFGRSGFWSDRRSRVLAVLIILFTRPSGEVWLNVGNSQVHFSLITFLLLLESFDGASRLKCWAARIVLMFAGLTGVSSIFFAPLFLYLFFREKQKERLTQFAILSACLCVQLFALLHGHPPEGRFTGFDFFTYPCLVFAKDLCLPLFGVGLTDGVISGLIHLRDHGGWQILTVAWLLFAGQLAGFAYLAKSCGKPGRVIFIAGFLLLTLGAYFGMFAPKWDAIYSRNAHRYFYSANVIFMLLLASAALSQNGPAVISRSSRVAAAILLLMAISGGMMTYRTTYCDSPAWPKWREEIKLWRADPSRPINTWPLGLQMRLNRNPTKN